MPLSVTDADTESNVMSLFDRLFGISTLDIPRPKKMEELAEELARSSTALERKLNEDRCASDPTRRECAPDIADILLAARYRRERP